MYQYIYILWSWETFEENSFLSILKANITIVLFSYKESKGQTAMPGLCQFAEKGNQCVLESLMKVEYTKLFWRKTCPSLFFQDVRRKKFYDSQGNYAPCQGKPVYPVRRATRHHPGVNYH